MPPAPQVTGTTSVPSSGLGDLKHQIAPGKAATPDSATGGSGSNLPEAKPRRRRARSSNSSRNHPIFYRKRGRARRQ